MPFRGALEIPEQCCKIALELTVIWGDGGLLCDAVLVREKRFLVGDLPCLHSAPLGRQREKGDRLRGIREIGGEDRVVSAFHSPAFPCESTC